MQAPSQTPVCIRHDRFNAITRLIAPLVIVQKLELGHVCICTKPVNLENAHAMLRSVRQHASLSSMCA